MTMKLRRLRMSAIHALVIAVWAMSASGCIKDLFRGRQSTAKPAKTADPNAKQHNPKTYTYEVNLETIENEGMPEAPKASSAGGPVSPADVAIIESGSLPEWLTYDNRRGFRLAPNYPTPLEPHRVLGTFSVEEFNPDRARGWDLPEHLQKRHPLLVSAAREVGASAMYRVSVQDIGNTRRYRYLAVSPSAAEPKFPSVDELLGKLKLKEEGFKEVRRFSVRLEDLPDRKPEPINFTRGRSYVVAIALQSEGVEIDPRRLVGFDFATATKGEAPKFEMYGRRYYEGPNHGLDGIWERARAGFLRDPAYETESAGLTFTTRFGSATKEPSKLYAGRGPAEVVIYERVLRPAEFTEKICGRCRSTAEQCSGRRLLNDCKPLRQCLTELGGSIAACQAAYEDL